MSIRDGRSEVFGPLYRQKKLIEQMICSADETISETSNSYSAIHNNAKYSNSLDGSSSKPSWKVLIYDDIGRDIIAPLLRVAELRQLGVTLHMSLSNRRQAIPDVPAVYFVSPTADNIQKLNEDCKNQLYDSMWIHFTSSIPRVLLELLAQGCGNDSQRIMKVYDMYSSFISLEKTLFTLHMQKSYAALNQPRMSDRDIEKMMESVVTGLLSALITMKIVPIIRAQKGGPSEMVARMLSDRIRELAVGRNSVFSDALSTANTERPLLLLLDRNIDLSVMLHHTWTYQALGHDVLQLHLNRITLPKTISDGFRNAKSYDLDSNDEFWAVNAGRPFPQVAEAVESALADYKKDVDAVNRQAGAVGDVLDEARLEAADHASSEALTKAVMQLPILRKRKQTIDMHTNIATAMLDCIKDRGLDGFFQLEDQLMSASSRANVDKNAVLALLKDQRGTPHDRMRLALIYYLSATSATANEVLSECRNALKLSGCEDLRALDYAKSIKAFSASIQKEHVSALGPGSKSGSSQQLKPHASSHLEKMMSTVVEHGVKGLTQVAQNFNKLMIEEDTAYSCTDFGFSDGESSGSCNRSIVFIFGSESSAKSSEPTARDSQAVPESSLVCGRWWKLCGVSKHFGSFETWSFCCLRNY